MSRRIILILLIVSTVNSINRPVYKIVLTQKGFAQFLQYDIETPPIREFTFCTWIRVFDLSHEQSLFTYVVNGNNRLLRLWLDTGGNNIQISINDKKSSSVPVNITKDTWRHVCFSFQSDYGAWALYLDGRLAYCEAAQSLNGYILPAAGSVIIGYGTGANGTPNGFEGEIFGANMILTSTIERNYTVKRDPHYRQKSFRKNRVIADNNIKYTVLDHETMNKPTSTSKYVNPDSLNTNHSSDKIKPLHSLIEYGDGFYVGNKKSKSIDMSKEKDKFDFSSNYKKNVDNENDHISFWNLVNNAKSIERKKVKTDDLFTADTSNLNAVSELETLPPPVLFNFKTSKPSAKSIYDLNENGNYTNKKDVYSGNNYESAETEIPSLPDKNYKVYGQWTSSKFANSVLNYIKSVNLKNREQKKIQSTLPLLKLNDAFPYVSDLKISKVRPAHPFQKMKFLDTQNDIRKRDIKYPKVNLKMLREDLRSDILEEYANTKPKFIEVSSKGNPSHAKDRRFYRNVDSKKYSKGLFSSKFGKAQPFSVTSISSVNKNLPSFDLYKSSNLMTILPFLKSSEYFVDEYDNIKSTSTNDMNTKSLYNGNKWHNVMSYNNDFTPRDIDVKSGKITNNYNIDKRIADANKRNPSLRLKYMPDNHKVVKNVNDDAMVEGRALALQISNSSDRKSNSVSILKYNHGYLPHQQNQQNLNNKIINNKFDLNKMFDQHVKLGNTLNERHIIGNNKMRQHKESYDGSDIDNEKDNAPPSLGSKVCKNLELFDRFFYIQPDGSIDVTDIISPVKEKNIAIEFIVQNYKRCSTKDSQFEKNPLLFIDWGKTPVRLFGGAYSKRTTDLCGFF